MFKELEKQFTEDLSKEKDRLGREIETLKKNLREEKKVHDQLITKEKQSFEEYKNSENKKLFKREEGVKRSEKELGDIDKERNILLSLDDERKSEEKKISELRVIAKQEKLSSEKIRNKIDTIKKSSMEELEDKKSIFAEYKAKEDSLLGIREGECKRIEEKLVDIKQREIKIKEDHSDIKKQKNELQDAYQQIALDKKECEKKEEEAERLMLLHKPKNKE